MDLSITSVVLSLLLMGISYAQELVLNPNTTIVMNSTSKGLAINCEVVGLNGGQRANLEWLNTRGNVIGPYSNMQTPRIYSMPMGKSIRLQFVKLENGDAGRYTCRGTIGGITMTKYIQLRQNKYVPPSIKVVPTLSRPIVGRRFEMTCLADGVPPPSFIFEKDKFGLSEDRHNMSVTKGVNESQGMLVIEDFRNTDQGNYSCVAYNRAGHVSRTVFVSPLVTPSAPDVSIVAVSPTTISLMITANRIDGQPIVAYSVVFSAEGDEKNQVSQLVAVNITSKGVQTQFVIRNLVPSRRYVISVSARNNMGYGAKATISAMTQTLRKPNRPVVTSPRFSATPNSYKLVWEKPETGGIPLTGYIVTYYQVELEVGHPDKVKVVVGDRKTLNIAQGDTTEIMLTDLMPKSTYQLQISAVNAVGRSMGTNKIFTTPPGEFKPYFADPLYSTTYGWVNHKTEIKCVANAVPPAAITWRHNNAIITDGMDFRIRTMLGSGQTTSILEVSVNVENKKNIFGEFTCIAQNMLGESEKTITLMQAVKPSAPNISVDEVTSTRFRLLIAKLQETGGQPIIEYRIVFYAKGNVKRKFRRKVPVNRNSKDLQSEFLIVNLEAGKQYFIRVTARNNLGYGAKAKMSVKTPTDKISSPPSESFDYSVGLRTENVAESKVTETTPFNPATQRIQAPALIDKLDVEARNNVIYRATARNNVGYRATARNNVGYRTTAHNNVVYKAATRSNVGYRTTARNNVIYRATAHNNVVYRATPRNNVSYRTTTRNNVVYKATTRSNVGYRTTARNNVGYRTTTHSNVGYWTTARNNVIYRATAHNNVVYRATPRNNVSYRTTTRNNVVYKATTRSNVGYRTTARNNVGYRTTARNNVGYRPTDRNNVGYGTTARNNVGYRTTARNNVGYRTTNRNNVGYGTTARNNVGYGTTDRNNVGYGTTDRNNVGYRTTARNNVGYRTTDRNNVGYGTTDRNNVGYRTTARNNVGYGTTDRNNVGYGTTDRNNVGYGTTDRNNVGYGTTDRNNVGYGTTDRNNVGYGTTDRNNVGYGTTDRNNVGYRTTARNNVDYGTTARNNVGYRTTDRNNVGYGTTDRTNVGYRTTARNNVGYRTTDRNNVGYRTTDRNNVSYRTTARNNVGYGTTARNNVSYRTTARNNVGYRTTARNNVGYRTTDRNNVGYGTTDRTNVGFRTTARNNVGYRTTDRNNVGYRTTDRNNVSYRTTARNNVGYGTTARNNVSYRTTARNNVGYRTTARNNVGYRTTARNNVSYRTTARNNVGYRTTARNNVSYRTTARNNVGYRTTDRNNVSYRTTARTNVGYRTTARNNVGYRTTDRNNVDYWTTDVRRVSAPSLRQPNPPQVTSPRTSGNPYSYLLVWEKPETGGIPLTGYKVKYYQVEMYEGDPDKVKVVVGDKKFLTIDQRDTTEARLNDLMPNSTYELQITAINAIGESMATNKIFTTLPDEHDNRS